MNTFKQFLIWWNNKKGSTHACLLWFIRLLPVNVITCQYYQQKVEDLRQTTNKSYEYYEKVDMDHLFHRIFFQWFSFLNKFWTYVSIDFKQINWLVSLYQWSIGLQWVTRNTVIYWGYIKFHEKTWNPLRKYLLKASKKGH